MRFSIWPTTKRPWDEILELTRHCEATGWDGVYVADHFMPHGDFTPDVDHTAPLDGDTLECWSVIAALAAAVPRLRLGTLVSSVTYRHPAVLANIAAAVDNISHGRLLLGIGAGWQVNEHAAYGIELGTVSERLDRFEEACEVISSLLRERHTTYAGKYYRVTDGPQPAGARAAPAAASDRRRRREAHDAHRGPLRRRVELLVDPRRASREGPRAPRPLPCAGPRSDRTAGVDAGAAVHVDRPCLGGTATARRPPVGPSSAHPAR